MIDATGNASRIVKVEPGTALSLSGLTATGGKTEKNGGGIYVEKAHLDLEGVSVSGNESFNSGYGGGISSEESEATIGNSSISGNRTAGTGVASMPTAIEEAPFRSKKAPF